MENRFFSRTGPLKRRFVFGVGMLSIITAGALFAGQMERNFPDDHPGRPDAQTWQIRTATERRGYNCARCNRLALSRRSTALITGRTASGYIAGVRQMWVASYTGVFDDEPTAMVVDGSGNIYVAGYTAIPDYSAYVTVKYNPQGQEEWSARYNPPNCISSAAGIAVDHSGNVYVTGTSETFGLGDPDYVTIKYNNSGQRQWLARYNGGANSNDYATAIAVDASGNVYVTGTSGIPSGGFATVKYDSSGQQQWVAQYGGPGTPVAIAVDSLGSIYVTGASAGQYATIKYNNSGQQQWVALYNGSENGSDQPAGMVIDSLENVYVTGTSWGSRGVPGGLSLYATVKYDNSGRQQWVAVYHGPGNGSQATGIGIDNFGNVYVTGGSEASDGVFEYATVKYDSVGQQQWASRYRAPDSTGDFATAIAVSNSGNAYVTGQSSGDYATIKYNSLGQEQWVMRYNGPKGFDDYARAIAVDRRENVYVTGASRQDAILYDWDFATVKYTPHRIPQPQPRP